MSSVQRSQVIYLVSLALPEAISAFLVDREAQRLTSATLRYYQQELGYFGDFARAQGLADLADVTPDLIRRWLLMLADRRGPGGVHASYRAIKAFLRWAWNEYEIAGPCPILKVKAPKLPQELLEPLSLDSLKAMMVTCDRSFLGDRDRAVLLCLLDSGLRAAEFCALDVADVELATGRLLVRHGKGNKARISFLGAVSRKALGRYLRHRRSQGPEALWVTREGMRLCYCSLRSLVRNRARAAGIPAPSLHSFRRAFALGCLRNGMDIVSLQRLLGHADLTVLRRYLAQTEGDLAEAHRRAGPVDHVMGGGRGKG